MPKLAQILKRSSVSRQVCVSVFFFSDHSMKQIESENYDICDNDDNSGKSHNNDNSYNSEKRDNDDNTDNSHNGDGCQQLQRWKQW